MRKYVKLVSALLILVMMMAQVVCVGAAVKASFTITAKQVDHFEKEITVNVTNGKNVSYVLIEEFDKYGALVAQEGAGFSNTEKLGVTVKVRPTEVAKLKVTVYEGTEEATREYIVGGNSYYNPGSATAPKEDYYTGLIGGSSSSSNNGTIIEGTFDPNKWYGYYDKEDYEVKKYDYYYVTCRTLNVRNGAGTWADKVGTLKRNAKIKVYDITKSGWAVIEYDGHLRYVSARYIDEY